MPASSFFGLIGAGTVEAIRFAGHTQQIEPVAKPPINTPSLPQESPAYKTLHDLFKTDFPNTLKAHTSFPITDQKGETIPVEAQLYMDFEAKSMFVGFYLPKTSQVYSASAYLADHHDIALDLTKYVPSGGRVGESTTSKDLTFSGRVYLYIEEDLPPKEIGSLTDLYSSKGLSAQFRGPQYRFMQALGSKASPTLIPTPAPSATPTPSATPAPTPIQIPSPTPKRHKRPSIAVKLVINSVSRKDISHRLQIENISLQDKK